MQSCQEIPKTWTFLFQDGTRSAAYKALQAPEFIRSPEAQKSWIRLWYERYVKHPRPQLQRQGPWMKTFMANSSEDFPEIRMHEGRNPFTGERDEISRGLPHDIKKHGQLDYRDFEVYGERVRDLRKYMDDRKPNDFWALIHDRRNKVQYYTFWSVIAVGILSILLGFMSLAVGIVQAVFAYKALNLPSTTTTNSSLTT